MSYTTLTIIIIVGLLIVSLFGKPRLERFKLESFDPVIDHMTHAKINSYGGTDYVSDKPPCSRGQCSCHTIPCPATYRDGIVCWSCEEAIYEPQTDTYY